MGAEKEFLSGLSTQAIKRLPYYLQYLRTLSDDGVKNVSAPMIAAHFQYTEIQVRKDFAAVSSVKGKPKSGFPIQDLIGSMERILGYHNVDQAVLVGTGLLGKALLSYRQFEEYGLQIVMAFDRNKNNIGKTINGKKIVSQEKIADLCSRMKVSIGIITVPEDQAQIVCDQLIAGGVKAIWNFAPVHLMVDSHILVQNENMAASLALLSKHLQEQMEHDAREE
ncbi:redox-sensing transcriptional repressor Rex [Scatolibacter rhodanostii]|uniref:redox-sensing transcriptional repressor Rex n=1 Tax=Scatolibacter rhodanostii TaxID=2014781 RepID=UPI000C07A3C6|nr:redox-sensing transcriptional repressor Rex [Scatolibacter rhodanostii]